MRFERRLRCPATSSQSRSGAELRELLGAAGKTRRKTSDEGLNWTRQDGDVVRADGLGSESGEEVVADVVDRSVDEGAAAGRAARGGRSSSAPRRSISPSEYRTSREPGSRVTLASEALTFFVAVERRRCASSSQRVSPSARRGASADGRPRRIRTRRLPGRARRSKPSRSRWPSVGRQESVEARQQIAGRVGVVGERRERGPQLPHRRGRREPMADDVADGHRDTAVRERERVVPIPTDLERGAAGLVSGCNRHAGRDGQASRAGARAAGRWRSRAPRPLCARSASSARVRSVMSIPVGWRNRTRPGSSRIGCMAKSTRRSVPSASQYGASRETPRRRPPAATPRGCAPAPLLRPATTASSRRAGRAPPPACNRISRVRGR